MKENDKELSFIPLTKAIIPPAGLIEHFNNCYWVVHPTKGLVFFRKHSAQCNSNKALAKRLVSKLYPWAEVRFIPSVFRSIDPHDYVDSS